MTQYQIGDKVHVEFTVKDLTGVVHLEREQINGSGKTLEGKAYHYIFDDDPAIVKHIPKPYAPTVGDKFMTELTVYEFLCVDGDYVGYRYTVSDKREGHGWCRLSVFLDGPGFKRVV